MFAEYIRACPRYAQSDLDIRRIYPRPRYAQSNSDVRRIYPRPRHAQSDFDIRRKYPRPRYVQSNSDIRRIYPPPPTRNRNQIDAARYAAIGISISSAGGFTATLGLNQNRNITKITADPIAGINQIDLQSCVITPFAPTV